MTTEELRRYFNDNFGLNPRPGMFEVDAETYANVCQSIFTWAYEFSPDGWGNGNKWIKISVGPNKGIHFKNIELILKKEN